MGFVPCIHAQTSLDSYPWCHEKSQNLTGIEECDQIPYMHEMTTLSKGHKESDSRKSTSLQVSERKSESKCLVWAFTVAQKEKQLQKENLKDIDWGHKNVLQSMRAPKGPKHYSVIVRVKDSILLIRNQRKNVSCNDNTTAFRKEKLLIGISTNQKDRLQKTPLWMRWEMLVPWWETTGNIVTNAARQ